MIGHSEPSLFIRLYLDEHVWRKIAAELRERGFDAVNVSEVGREGLPDEEQWGFAAAERRALLTFDKEGGRLIP
jgi:predicted nuclease of predicted toxin-antitoxin system